MLIVLLFCLIKYRGSDSYIYYISSLFLIYDIINSELITHNNSFWFIRSRLPGQTSEYIRGILFVLLTFLCLILFIYSWISIFKALKGQRWFEIALVLILIFPSVYSLLVNQIIDPYSTFFIFCFGLTTIFSVLIEGSSKTSLIKFLQGIFLIMLLILTNSTWYRVDLLWGIIFAVILVCILIILPVVLRKNPVDKQSVFIILFELVVILGFAIFQIVGKTYLLFSVTVILQFFLLQGLILLYYKKEEGQRSTPY